MLDCFLSARSRIFACATSVQLNGNVKMVIRGRLLVFDVRLFGPFHLNKNNLSFDGPFFSLNCSYSPSFVISIF